VISWLIPLVTLVVGALLSGVATYIGTRSKLRFDYDADLRQRRIDAYADLWRRLEPLAKYVRTPSFTPVDADNLAASLRNWYFRTGGLFLSATARGDYFALQGALARVTSGWGWETSDRQRLTSAAREMVRTYGSRMRTSLTRDVGTRARPRLPGNLEPFDRSLVSGTYKRDDDGQRLDLKFRPRALGGRPQLTLHGMEPAGTRTVKALRWVPSEAAIRAQLYAPSDVRERVLFFESGQLIEGPSPNGDDAPPPAALWTRVKDQGKSGCTNGGQEGSNGTSDNLKG